MSSRSAPLGCASQMGASREAGIQLLITCHRQPIVRDWFMMARSMFWPDPPGGVGGKPKTRSGSNLSSACISPKVAFLD